MSQRNAVHLERFKVRRVTLSALTACVLEAGQGPPLLLLPSPLVRIRSYRPLIARLIPHFHLFVLEMPGSGDASRIAKPWTFEQYAACAAEFIQLRCIDRPLVIGHSNAGAIALLLGATAPELISGIILADSVGLPRSLPRLLVGRAIDSLIELKLTLLGWVDLAYNIARHPRNFAEQVRLSSISDLSAVAQSLRPPVLLAWGRRDHTEPLGHAQRLQQLIPHAQQYISARGSHDWLITHADEFAEMVRSFHARSVLRPSPPPYCA